MDYSKKSHNNKWKDSDVEKHWDSVANIYVAENNKVKETHDQRFKETISMLELPLNAKVLNISSRDCEADDYVKMILPESEVMNAEISSGLMQVAQSIRPHVKQTKIETYSELPFNNGFFNRIICLETLEHVENPIGFLMELNRVSTENTRMVLSCPPRTSEIPYQIFTFLFGGHGEGPHRFLPSREVKAMLKKTGWKLILHKGTILLPVGPKKIQNWGEKIIQKFPNSWISEMGIRQFYVCEKLR